MNASSDTSEHWRVDRPLDPIEGESLDGYVLRCSVANWLPNTLALGRLAGVDHHQVANLGRTMIDGLPALADCLGVPAGELVSRAYPVASEARRARLFFGTAVPVKDIESAARRFSPTSLATSAHHRAVWQIRPLPFCEESWTFLTDRCTRCQGVQRWYHAVTLDVCERCGSPLADQETPAVPEALRDDLSFACGVVHPSPERRARTLASLPEGLADIGGDAVWALLRRTMSLIDPAIAATARTSGVDPEGGALALATVAAEAAAMLRCWPDGPIEWMVERLAVSTSRFSDGNGARSMHYLKNMGERLPAPAARALAELRERVDMEGPAGDRLREETRDLYPASKDLRLAHIDMTWMRRERVLKTRFTVERKSAVARYEAREIDELKRFLDRRALRGHAIDRLGIGLNGVEQLMAADLLECRRDLFALARFGCAQTTTASVEDLVSRCEAAARPGDGLPLRRAMRIVGGRLKPWGTVFRALLDGDIPFSLGGRVGGLTARILVPHHRIQEFVDMPFPSADEPFPYSTSMSDRDAGEALNVKWASFGPLVTGLHDGEGRIPIEALLGVLSRCVSNVEIGYRLGVSTRRVDVEAAKARVRSAGFRTWDRADAEKAFGIRLSAEVQAPTIAEPPSFATRPPWSRQWDRRGPWGVRPYRGHRKTAATPGSARYGVATCTTSDRTEHRTASVKQEGMTAAMPAEGKDREGS